MKAKRIATSSPNLLFQLELELWVLGLVIGMLKDNFRWEQMKLMDLDSTLRVLGLGENSIGTSKIAKLVHDSIKIYTLL